MEPRLRLKQLMDVLVSRRRLYLPSSHYAVVVAYLLGLDAGLGGDTLSDFGKWLGSPSIVWWGQIEEMATGGEKSGPGGISDMVDRLSPLDSEKCVQALSTALNSFVAGDPSPKRKV